MVRVISTGYNTKVGFPRPNLKKRVSPKRPSRAKAKRAAKKKAARIAAEASQAKAAKALKARVGEVRGLPSSKTMPTTAKSGAPANAADARKARLKAKARLADGSEVQIQVGKRRVVLLLSKK